MSEEILTIRHLSKSFGANVVLRDIDFTVNKGDVISVIGASGSGKSTLLRCINLLEAPTSGEIFFHGEPVTDGGINADWIWNMTDDNKRVKVLIFDDKARTDVPVSAK